jgi:hypothetical protein
MEDKTVDCFRMCFSTEAGKRVLANLMMEAKFFEETTTLQEQAVENFMKMILTKTGGYNRANVDHYITNLMNLPRIEGKRNG